MVTETGLSDFHNICVTVRTIFYSKQKRTIIRYRKLSDFKNEAFMKNFKVAVTFCKEYAL